MKILVVTDLFPPDVVGGYELRCEEAVEWLSKKGNDIVVLTTKSSFNEKRRSYEIERILKKYPGGQTPMEWSFIRRFCYAVKDNYLFRRAVRKFRPDRLYLWHCQGISRSLIPEVFNSHVPTIVDVSDKWLYKVSREKGPIYGIITRRSTSYLKQLAKGVC